MSDEKETTIHMPAGIMPPERPRRTMAEAAALLRPSSGAGAYGWCMKCRVRSITKENYEQGRNLCDTCKPFPSHNEAGQVIKSFPEQPKVEVGTRKPDVWPIGSFTILRMFEFKPELMQDRGVAIAYATKTFREYGNSADESVLWAEAIVTAHEVMGIVKTKVTAMRAEKEKA